MLVLSSGMGGVKITDFKQTLCVVVIYGANHESDLIV